MEDTVATRTHRLKLIDIKILSDTVRQLDLRPLSGGALPYREGQFLSICLQDKLQRSYSMAAPSVHDGRIELHVRLLPGGRFSEWLRGDAKIGEVLDVIGPFGNCTWREPPSITTQIIMLATGTGIAPLKAMLEKVLTVKSAQPIALYWGGRTAADLYLHHYFSDLATVHQNLRYSPVLTEPDAHWSGATGFVQTAVADDYPDLSDAIVYACGALRMVEAARELLTTTRRLAEGCFHADVFAPATRQTTAPGNPLSLRIELEHAGGEQRSLTTAADVSLMHALAEAQLLRGVCGGHAACGTCLVTIAADWIEHLTPPNHNEKRLLAAMGNDVATYRLACQIPLHTALNGLRLRLQA